MVKHRFFLTIITVIMTSGCMASPVAEDGSEPARSPEYTQDELEVMRKPIIIPRLINSTAVDGHFTFMHSKGCSKDSPPASLPRLSYIVVDSNGHSVHTSMSLDGDERGEVQIALHGPGPWIFAGIPSTFCMTTAVTGIEELAFLPVRDYFPRNWIEWAVRPELGSMAATTSFSWPPYTFAPLGGYKGISEGDVGGKVTLSLPDGTPVVSYERNIFGDDYEMISYLYFEEGDHTLSVELDAPATANSRWGFQTPILVLNETMCWDWMDLSWLCGP